MTTNVSSGLTKYKLLLTDTGQADNATGCLAKGAGWDMRGTDCGQARTWGELTWGKWDGLRHEGQMGHAETWGELTGAKWDRLRHEGNWLGPKKNGHNAQNLSAEAFTHGLRLAFHQKKHIQYYCSTEAVKRDRICHERGPHRIASARSEKGGAHHTALVILQREHPGVQCNCTAHLSHLDSEFTCGTERLARWCWRANCSVSYIPSVNKQFKYWSMSVLLYTKHSKKLHWWILANVKWTWTHN